MSPSLAVTRTAADAILASLPKTPADSTYDCVLRLIKNVGEMVEKLKKRLLKVNFLGY